MKLRNLSSLICEVVQASVAKGTYPDHGDGNRRRRYWMVLGKYVDPRTPEKGEHIAVIDLRGVVNGGIRKKKGKNKETALPGFGVEGLQKLRMYLPEILGFVSDKELTKKPQVSVAMVTDIMDKYGEEGVERLGQMLKDPEILKDPTKILRHEKIKYDRMTKDILNQIENLSSMKMKPRPLKGTTASSGRYQMGRHVVPDSTVNAIFEHWYRTPLLSEFGDISHDVLTALEKPSDQEQAKELFKIAESQIREVEKEVPEITKPEAPPEELEPEVPEAPPEEPEVATPEEPLYAKPEEKPETATKKIDPQRILKAPAPKLKPELQRKPGQPEAEVGFEPTTEPPISEPEQKEIESRAKETIKRADLRPGRVPVPKKPILKATPKKPPIEPEETEPGVL